MLFLCQPHLAPSASSASFSLGPKMCGKNWGRMRPSTRLASAQSGLAAASIHSRAGINMLHEAPPPHIYEDHTHLTTNQPPDAPRQPSSPPPPVMAR